jgi:hypothetical protein
MAECVNCGCEAGFTSNGNTPKEFCDNDCKKAFIGCATSIWLLKRHFGLNVWVEKGVKYI